MEIGNTLPTLLDLANQMGADGVVTRDIIEVLDQGNPALSDIPFIPCNDGSGHKAVIRTGLPTPTWRRLNYGVKQNKGTTAQVRDACGMLEDYSECDKSMARLSGDVAQYRKNEDDSHLQGMAQEWFKTLFYGNSGATPEKFMGIAPRFSDKNAKNGVNIIDAGGRGSDNTSIYIVAWGNKTIHGIYPQGSPGGLEFQDMGEQTLIDRDGGKFQGYRSHFKWDAGISMPDWRGVVRIANIDVSDLSGDLTKAGATGADLIDLMAQAMEMIPADLIGQATPVIYCNRTISGFLRRQATRGKNVSLGLEEVGGRSITTFDGFAIRRIDTILSTEAAVV